MYLLRYSTYYVKALLIIVQNLWPNPIKYPSNTLLVVGIALFRKLFVKILFTRLNIGCITSWLFYENNNFPRKMSPKETNWTV